MAVRSVKGISIEDRIGSLSDSGFLEWLRTKPWRKWKLLGEGSASMVYVYPGSRTKVIKHTRTDMCWDLYAELIVSGRVSSRYLPVVHATRKTDSGPTSSESLSVVERLRPHTPAVLKAYASRDPYPVTWLATYAIMVHAGFYDSYRRMPVPFAEKGILPALVSFADREGLERVRSVLAKYGAGGAVADGDDDLALAAMDQVDRHGHPFRDLLSRLETATGCGLDMHEENIMFAGRRLVLADPLS